MGQNSCYIVVVLYNRFNFKNYTFCTQKVYVLYVSQKRETADISLRNINWMILLTEKECAECAVRSESSSKIRV